MCTILQKKLKIGLSMSSRRKPPEIIDLGEFKDVSLVGTIDLKPPSTSSTPSSTELWILSNQLRPTQHEILISSQHFWKSRKRMKALNLKFIVSSRNRNPPLSIDFSLPSTMKEEGCKWNFVRLRFHFLNP